MHEYLFVYGTLKRGQRNPFQARLAAQADYIGEGRVNGRLYRVAAYPGFICDASSRSQVSGSLYRLREAETTLQWLDEHERCSKRFPEPREYLRQRVTVRLASGESLNAWTYCYNRSVKSLKRIARW